jgi:hypothetical protein
LDSGEKTGLLDSALATTSSLPIESSPAQR